MIRQLFESMLAAALVCGVFAQPAASQSPEAYKAPRTSDGHADLQGIWQVRDTAAAFDLEDHAGALGIPPGAA